MKQKQCRRVVNDPNECMRLNDTRTTQTCDQFHKPLTYFSLQVN